MQFAYQSYDPESLFTEEQAAQFLQLSARTLQAWRVRGGGPSFCRCGRAVRYRRRELVEWQNARIRANTSQARGK